MLAGRNFILANADAWTLEAFGKRGTLGTTQSLTINSVSNLPYSLPPPILLRMFLYILSSCLWLFAT